MLSCVFCKSERVVKNGVLYGRQRYLCKDCKKNFKTGIRRSKYSLEDRIKIIRSYINGVGFRQISRIFEIPLTTVFDFIKRVGIKLEKQKKEESMQRITDKEIIEILEADELFTYIKKSQNIALKKKHLKENL